MDEALIAETARRHGLGEGAVRTLAEALVRGGGQAQFSHPELGGVGQWSGGMVQIDATFNDALKAKVSAACADLAIAAQSEGQVSGRASSTSSRDAWWPEELGRPSSAGTQNDGHYAVFPETRRLAVVQGGRVTVYDTGDLRITGVSQRQSTCSALAFTSPAGPVMLDALRVVGSQEVGRNEAAPTGGCS